MSTETVAILFTDIVGSTELSQRLSAEAADEVRRGHFSLPPPGHHRIGGTEVKNLGDGLMVVFRSASAALAAPWPCNKASNRTIEACASGAAGRAQRGESAARRRLLR